MSSLSKMNKGMGARLMHHQEASRGTRDLRKKKVKQKFQEDEEMIQQKRRLEQVKKDRQHMKPFRGKTQGEEETVSLDRPRKRLKIMKLNVQNDEDYPQVDERLPQHPFRLGVVAPSGSGKTTALVNLIGRKDMLANYFDQIHIFSPSLFTDPNWEPILAQLPEYMLHRQVTMEGVKAVMDQIAHKNRKRKNKLDYDRALILIDDPVGKNLFSHSAYEGPLEELQTSARQKGISTAFATQNYHVYGKKVRNNFTDLLSLGNLLTNEELKDISKEQRGPLSDKDFTEKFNEFVKGPHDPFFIRKKYSDLDKRFRPGFSD